MLKMKFFAKGVQRLGRREILSRIKANIWVCRKKVPLGLPFFFGDLCRPGPAFLLRLVLVHRFVRL